MLATITVLAVEDRAEGIELFPDSAELVWGAVAFLALLAFMYKFVFPKLNSTLEERSAAIQGRMEEAEAKLQEAEASKRAFEASIADAKGEAQRIIDEAKVTADQLRADVVARAEQEGNTDGLTGLLNRRALDRRVHEEFARIRHDGDELAVALLDLDHFKQINDSFGHETGDEVLVQVADLIRSSTRMDDRFFRLGGEEFGLLLPGANATSLMNVAEKLRLAVEREVQCHGRNVTISIGAAPFHPGESPADWLGRADAAMYEAKRNGRNRTVLKVPTEPA
jgi:diguanylate cyclase (GGDEF)-like protein